MPDRIGPSLLDDARVVLLRPRWARNLGSVARAMKNFGLKNLTLVDSCIGSWTDAWQMAVQADDVLQDAVLADDLEAALAPAHWVVGTTNDPPAGVRVLTPREVAQEARGRGAPTLLFGGEINGLHPAELLRCHVVSVIPTAPVQSSLNLSQAVCLYASELFLASQSEPDAASGGDVVRQGLATTEMMQHCETALRHLLESSVWINKSRPKNAIAQLMQPLYRAQLTDDEVRAWLVALAKAATQTPS